MCGNYWYPIIHSGCGCQGRFIARVVKFSANLSPPLADWPAEVVFALHPIPLGAGFENLFNYLIIIDARDQMHRALAKGTDQSVSFLDFLYQARPILSERLVSKLRFQDASN